VGSRTLRAQTLKVRREIRTLSTADIDALKAGISAMKALPKTNSRSWLYQCGVHGALPAESAGVPDAGTYWNQCVHSGPHFLSWHRWELLFLEEIIRLMSDQCAFTLPYWDYIANGFLPDPLRVPADATNPLFDDTRGTSLNDGTGGLSGLNTTALNQVPFDLFSSILYGNPHGAVHGQIVSRSLCQRAC
jgi:tyrosinase